jgi:hypothetical protein
MSKVDYCLKCPAWGGDGLCNVGCYDDPSEPWCIQTFGGEEYYEDEFDSLEFGSPEYYAALWKHLSTVPFGEKIFEEIIEEDKKLEQEAASKPLLQTSQTPYTQELVEMGRTLQEPKISYRDLKSRGMLGKWLLEVHQKSDGLSFNEIIDLLKFSYDRKQAGSEKCEVADKVRRFVRKGKLRFKNGKTYLV